MQKDQAEALAGTIEESLFGVAASVEGGPLQETAADGRARRRAAARAYLKATATKRQRDRDAKGHFVPGWRGGPGAPVRTPLQDGLDKTLRAVFISPNVRDANGESANMVDALDSIARALRDIAKALRPLP